MKSHRALAGAWAGAVAGAAAAGTMYAADLLLGVRPLPDVLQQPLLEAVPGWLFGFLIDNLQHAGKVIEEAGLLLAMLGMTAALGAAAVTLTPRRSPLSAGLLAGAAGWALVTLVVLPLAGDGVLGLAEGAAVPVAWGLIFAVYALVLESARRPVQSGPVDVQRRRFLRLVPVAAGTAGLAVVAGFRFPEWAREVTAPPEANLSGSVPEITPIENFYGVSKNFSDPAVPGNGWALRIVGLVGEPLRLSLAELRDLPSRTAVVTMECVSNNVGGPLMSTISFTGVPLRELAARARPRAEAAALTFRARDGFTESLPLSVALGSPDIMVAYLMGGRPLLDRHGFPARLLVPGRYGMKGPKWLDEVELTASERSGYWEAQGWDQQAIVKTTSRFDFPRDGDIIRAGAVPLGGVAFAGDRGIQAVEWSADGGRNWERADLKPPLSPLTWVLWRATWTALDHGPYTLVVRARDGQGDLQPASAAPSYPSGATGLHRVRVNVGR